MNIVQYQADYRALIQVFMTEMRAEPSFTVDIYSPSFLFDGYNATRNNINAYEQINYSVGTSYGVQGVRLNAEL